MRGDLAARRGQPEDLRLPVEVTPGGAALHARRAGDRIDMDSAHLREVDDEPPVVDRLAGDVVAPASNGEGEMVLPGEIDRLDDIGRAGRSDDHRRLAVDEAILDHAGLIVPGVASVQDHSPHPAHELGDGCVVQHRHAGAGHLVSPHETFLPRRVAC